MMLHKRQNYATGPNSTITLSGKTDVASNMVVQVTQKVLLQWPYGTKKKGENLKV